MSSGKVINGNLCNATAGTDKSQSKLNSKRHVSSVKLHWTYGLPPEHLITGFCICKRSAPKHIKDSRDRTIAPVLKECHCGATAEEARPEYDVCGSFLYGAD